MTRKLEYAKRENNTWYNLETLDTSGLNSYAVYISWNGYGQYLSAGYGNLKEKLYSLQNTDKILEHSKSGIYVTWANAPLSDIEGIAKYLDTQCSPIIQDNDILFMNAQEIAVNLPDI